MPRNKISYVDMWWDILDAGIWRAKDGTLYPVVSMSDEHLIRAAKKVVEIANIQHSFRLPEDREKQVVDFVSDNPIWKHIVSELKKRGMNDELARIAPYRTGVQ